MHAWHMHAHIYTHLQDLVKELDLMLRDRKVGLVAHYYMDPELQVSG